MIAVTPRARRHADNAGDPLDGLVNLFDLGIVLSVAFLLAALSSLNLAKAFTSPDQTGSGSPVTIKPGDQTGTVPPQGSQVVGNGTRVGSVYRLSEGRLIYVVPK